MMGSLTNINSIVEAQKIQQRQVNISDETAIVKNSSWENNRDLSDSKDNKIFNSKNINDFKNLLNKAGNKKSDLSIARNKKTTRETKKEVSKSESKEIDDEKIEKELESLTDEQLIQLLNMMVEFLNSALKDEVKIVDNSQLGGISEDLKVSLMEVLNSKDLIDDLSALQQSNNNLLGNSQDVFGNLLNLLNKADAAENIDADTLKLAGKLLNQISDKLDGNLASQVDKASLTQAVNESINKLNELLNSKMKDNNDELSLQNNSLNNMYKVIQESNTSDNSDSNNYSSEQSQDEKILQSILGEKNNDTPVPVFTTTTVVNNSAGAVVETQQTVDVRTMATDIVRNVKYMATNDMREMIVKVNPGNLGEITIKLIEENGNMKLHMKAVSKETYSLLVQQSSDIKSQLSEQNIKIHDVNISLYEDDTTFFKEGEFSRSFSGEQGNKGNGKTHKADLNINDSEEIQEYDDLNALNMLV